MRRVPLVALLTAEIVSVTGSQTTRLALPWFVLVTSHSPTRMSLVLAVQMVAMAGSGIFTGPLAARLGPRKVLLVGDLARAVLVGLVPLLHWWGLLSFPLVLVVAFGIGVFFTPHHSARLTLLPILAGDDDHALARANSVLQAVNRTALLLGPPLAGVLVGLMGAATVLWIDVATFLISFTLVFYFVRVGRPGGDRRPRAGFVSGLRITFGDSVLRPWTIAVTFFEGVWQFMVAAVPLMTYLYFDGDARLAGLLMAVIGAGAITGNLLSLRLITRLDRRRLILGGTALQSVAFWGLIADPAPWPFALLLLIASFALGIAEGPMTATQVGRIPAPLRAQSIGAFFTLTLLGGAAGTLTAAPALEHAGPHTAFLLPALSHTLGTIILAIALHRLGASAPPSAKEDLPDDDQEYGVIA